MNNTIFRIRERAKEKGKTLKYLCKKLGYSGRTYFSDIENKGGIIPDDKLEIVARELETTVAYLKCETDEKEMSLDQDVALIDCNVALRTEENIIIRETVTKEQMDILKSVLKQFKSKK